MLAGIVMSLAPRIVLAIATVAPPGAGPPDAASASHSVAAASVAAPRRLVVASSLGMNFGLFAVPSAEVSLFLGGALGARKRANTWTALGFRGDFDVGLADLPLNPTIVAGRGHLAVLGERGRLMYSAGLGAAFFPLRAYSEGLQGYRLPVAGLDVDGRIGVVFGRRADTRIHGVFGGQLRITGVFAHAYERSVNPQIGLFMGLVRAPDLPLNARAPTMPPRRGLGVLIPGVALLAGFVGGVAVTVAGFHADNTGSTRCGPCSFLGLITTPMLFAAGAPLTVVGSVRVHRYRRWRGRVVPAPTGFAVRF